MSETVCFLHLFKNHSRSEIMKKIKELIDQVGKPSLVNKKSSHDEVNIQPSSFNSKDESRQYLRNPQVDLETIESIDSVYFNADHDVNLHELELCSGIPTLAEVEKRQRKLRSQLNAVTKKLSDVILENQPSYTKELKEVQQLQKSLHNAFVICSNSRRFLMSVNVRSSTVHLALLNHHQKRQKLQTLCEALQTIKTLQHTDVRLREMLEEEDYDGAIQLCLECLRAAATYKHYHCIKDLSSKLQDTLELIEEQVDVTLSKSCVFFDKKLYAKLQSAYQLLGKTQSAIDQLLMHYTTCIHNTAFQIVLGYAELGKADKNLQKKQYKDLCQHTTEEIYVPCLMALCKSLWGIINCYHKTSKWHQEEFEQKCDVTDSELTDYVNRKLSHGRHRVWVDVQSRVRTFLLSSDLNNFKYDDFIAILDIVKRFILIGENFCHLESTNAESIKASDNLNDPLRKQTLSYFQSHHAGRMEELLMFLENEAWQPCPVKPTFSVWDMQEFKFLKLHEDPFYAMTTKGMDQKELQDEAVVSGFKYFDPYPCEEDSHPFSDLEQQNINKNTSKPTQIRYDSYEQSDEDDVDDELRQEFVDENTGDSPMAGGPTKSRSNLSICEGPILTNTALHVLRLCGSYMKMCDVLKPISMDVIVCMSQLFDLYFYAVYHFFATQEEYLKHNTERLAPTLQHLQETLFYAEEADDEMSVKKMEHGKIRRPHVASLISLSHSDNYYGINERIVATESLVFLSEQLITLRKLIEQMIPQSKKAFLNQFYSQTVNFSPLVRLPVYFSIATHSFGFFDTIEQMSTVNWDIGEIMSQHNLYVDQLLQNLVNFKSDLHSSVRSVKLPDDVLCVIWEQCIRLCNQAFVEGFSNVRKCSNEGRALMQLDYQQFLLKFEKLTNIRPIPGREFVESYIKAYYLTEVDLEQWVKEHNVYSQKQLSALVNCSAATYSSSSASGNRKTKQRMLSIIEELTSRKSS